MKLHEVVTLVGAVALIVVVFLAAFLLSHLGHTVF